MADRGNPYDPFFLASRREAVIIFGCWLTCLLWTVTYCYLFGYGQPDDPSQLPLVLGVPAWVFWGVAMPWLVADGFTIWFCMRYISDGELEQVEQGHGSESTEGGA